MYQGIIKKLSEKGFGFITIEGREKDLFFHAQSLSGISFRELKEGDTVQIESIESTERGYQAVGVSVIN